MVCMMLFRHKKSIINYDEILHPWYMMQFLGYSDQVVAYLLELASRFAISSQDQLKTLLPHQWHCSK